MALSQLPALVFVIVLVLASRAVCGTAGQSFTIDYQNDTFLKDGVPFR